MALNKDLDSYELAKSLIPWIKTVEMVKKTKTEYAKEFPGQPWVGGNAPTAVISGQLMPGAFEVVTARNRKMQDFNLIMYKKKYFSHLVEKGRVIEIGFPVKDFADFAGLNKKHIAHAKESWYMDAKSASFFEDLANSMESFQGRMGVV